MSSRVRLKSRVTTTTLMISQEWSIVHDNCEERRRGFVQLLPGVAQQLRLNDLHLVLALASRLRNSLLPTL